MTDRPVKRTPPESTGAWWRFPMMWLVVGGPLVVVVAAVITIRGADLIVDDSYSARGAVPNGSYAPAVKARNHAATPPAER